jgi:hypothetical protein
MEKERRRIMVIAPNGRFDRSVQRHGRQSTDSTRIVTKSAMIMITEWHMPEVLKRTARLGQL